jgi:hypothetical protein
MPRLLLRTMGNYEVVPNRIAMSMEVASLCYAVDKYKMGMPLIQRCMLAMATWYAYESYLNPHSSTDASIARPGNVGGGMVRVY